MKRSLTVRLPDSLIADIQSESKARHLSTSDVVRERLQAPAFTQGSPSLDSISDLIGSVGDLPPDVSGQKKDYLRKTGYGRKRHR